MTTRWAEPDLEDYPKKGPMRWWTRRILGMRPAFAGVATPLLAALLAAVGTGPLEQAVPSNVPRRPMLPLAPTPPYRMMVGPREAWTIDPQMIHQARPGIDEAMIHSGRLELDPRMIIPVVPEAVTTTVPNMTPVPGGYAPLPPGVRSIPPPPVPGFPIVPYGPRFRGPGGTTRPR